MSRSIARLSLIALAVFSVSCSGMCGRSGPSETVADAGVRARGPNALPLADLGQAPVRTLKGRPEQLHPLIDLLIAASADVARAEFDPAALAQSLGNDPQKLFEWVRDRTWWAPYRGLLRGATGVMLDRVGSNLDRAVLLGDLMRRSGRTVRMAHAVLQEDQARTLLGELRPIPDVRRPRVAPTPVRAAREHAIDAILPGAEKYLRDEIAYSTRLFGQAQAVVRMQTSQLLAATRGMAAPNAVNDDQQRFAMLQDHWWVEYEVDGKWIAMDVLRPDARIGDEPAAASTRFVWKRGEQSPAIPPNDWHSVQIRVVIERYEDGATSESTVLESVVRPADVIDRPISLAHIPKPWPKLMADRQITSNALKAAALSVSEWTPVLKIGDELFVQSGFADSGDLASFSTDSPGAMGDITGSFGGFGSALGGGDESRSFATAEWIDFEVRVPGETSQSLRRTVFDLLGPAKRAAKAAGLDAGTEASRFQRFEALSGRTYILLQASDWTADFVAHLLSRSIAANEADLRSLSRVGDRVATTTRARTVLDRLEDWGPLPNLVLWRSALEATPSDTYINRANVLTARINRSILDLERGVGLIDIASNPSGVRRTSARGAFEARLQRGVADTVAEWFALGDHRGTAENIASMFAAAGYGIDQGVRVAASDISAVRKLGWPSDTAARLEEHINTGYLAIGLKQPIRLGDRQRLGWWRIDPKSGETVGVMDTGFHQNLTERLETERRNLNSYLWEPQNWREYQDLQWMAQQGLPMSAESQANLQFYQLVHQTVKQITTLLMM